MAMVFTSAAICVAAAGIQAAAMAKRNDRHVQHRRDDRSHVPPLIECRAAIALAASLGQRHVNVNAAPDGRFRYPA
ncbi:MAG: hypothetical protein QM766_12250 [Burkholderiaceae bacterium]